MVMEMDFDSHLVVISPDTMDSLNKGPALLIDSSLANSRKKFHNVRVITVRKYSSSRESFS
jgi:hypothetical protein